MSSSILLWWKDPCEWHCVAVLSTHFFETWSQGGRIWKRRPCVLVWTANPHTYPTPRPLALDLLNLRRLITTTTMVDYRPVLVLQKILSPSGLLGQNILLCTLSEKGLWTTNTNWTFSEEKRWLWFVALMCDVLLRKLSVRWAFRFSTQTLAEGLLLQSCSPLLAPLHFLHNLYSIFKNKWKCSIFISSGSFIISF